MTALYAEIISSRTGEERVLTDTYCRYWACYWFYTFRSIQLVSEVHFLPYPRDVLNLLLPAIPLGPEIESMEPSMEDGSGGFCWGICYCSYTPY